MKIVKYIRKYLPILIAVLLMFLLVAATDQKPIVWKENCAGCGDCTKYCSVQAIKIINDKAVIDHNKCINCKLCVTTCTFDAIK